MMSELRAVRGGLEPNRNDRVVVPLITVLSILVPMAVAALLLFPDVLKLELGINRGTLPAFHAMLNGSTAILLIAGLWFIRKRNLAAHRTAMMTAFGFSAVFLVSYVISKLNADPMPYGGEGVSRYIYFFVLVSHILLSIPVLPLAMFAIYRGVSAENARHRKIVRWTFPIWLYVAVTGVLVYLFMAPYY